MTTTITTTGGVPVEGVRIADLPVLGMVTDDTSFVGEHAGSGRFTAPALRDYVAATIVTDPSGGPFLPLDGHVAMTGPLTLSGSPTIASQAANKAYVDAHSGGGAGVDHWVFVTDHGAAGDGTTDDSAAINAAIAFAAPGQEVWLSPTGRHFCASTIALLKGRTLRGGWNVPGNTNPGNIALDLTTLNGALILPTGATVRMDSGSGIKGVPIYRQGLVTPAASSAGFGGTGITINGDDVYVGYCLIMGFATGISSTSGGGNSWARQKIEWVYGDNNNGILIDNSHDTPYISHCHFWPFTSISPTSPMTAHQRTGTAFNLTNSDLISLSHNFCIAYQTGYHIGQDGGAFLLDCQADWIINGATGFLFDTGIEGTRAMGCVAFGAAGSTGSTGYWVNVPATDYMEFTACYSNSCATAYEFQSGDGRISGGTVDHATIAVTVAASGSIVSLCGGFRAEVISNAVVYNPGGGGGIYIDPDCDFSRINLGGGSASVSSTMLPIIIPSASPLFLPAFFDVFEISGTTGFGILNNGWAGRKAKLIFQGALTVFHSGTSGGISLVGGANVTTYIGMVLDLVHNGFQWFEAGHSSTYTGSGGSLTSPGWRRNADGSIENWAVVTTNGSGVGTFSFSQPFSSFLLTVQATAQTAGDANVCVTVGTQSLSSIPIYAANGSTGVGLATGVFCHAIGR
jgi:hypothetical protein